VYGRRLAHETRRARRLQAEVGPSKEQALETLRDQIARIATPFGRQQLKLIGNRFRRSNGKDSRILRRSRNQSVVRE
jgi:hypothetical protein